MRAFDWFKDYLTIAGASNIGGNWQCPSHEDSYPSLSIKDTTEGHVLLFCHAGCSYKQIMESLGLGTKILFQPHFLSPKRTFELNRVKPKFKSISYRSMKRRCGKSQSYFVFHHQYTKTVRLERIKFDDGEKICRWQIFEDGKWMYSNGMSLNLNELPLYNEVEVIRGGFMGEVIVLCESESSVDAMLSEGIYATTWAGGAKSAKIERLKKVLTNQKVIWIPDNDEAGLKCSTQITAEIKPLTQKWLTLIGEPNDDAKDLLIKGKINLKIIDSLFR